MTKDEIKGIVKMSNDFHQQLKDKAIKEESLLFDETAYTIETEDGATMVVVVDEMGFLYVVEEVIEDDT